MKATAKSGLSGKPNHFKKEKKEAAFQPVSSLSSVPQTPVILLIIIPIFRVNEKRNGLDHSAHVKNTVNRNILLYQSYGFPVQTQSDTRNPVLLTAYLLKRVPPVQVSLLRVSTDLLNQLNSMRYSDIFEYRLLL